MLSLYGLKISILVTGRQRTSVGGAGSPELVREFLKDSTKTPANYVSGFTDETAPAGLICTYYYKLFAAGCGGEGFAV